MIDIALHMGVEHPNVLWLGATALLSFGAGLGLGLYAGTVSETSTEAVTDPEKQ